jgi:hypothetical protein
VRVDPVNETTKADLLTKLTAQVQPVGKVGQGGAAYVFSGRLNDSFRALNLLFDKGVAVRRADKAAEGVRQGDFIVAGGPDVLAPIAKQTGVDFTSLKAEPQGTREVKRARIAVYQRYNGGNADEGWTRLMLEQYNFPYATLMDAEIKKGNLNEKYDVIVIPEDSTATLTGERGAAAAGRGGAAAAAGREGFGGGQPRTPPEYRSGFGTEGVNALRAFVQKGGTLVTLGDASNFAIERLGVGVRNIMTNRSTKEFWCPGSTLRMNFDNTNPLAYGMPAEGLGVYLQGNPAFEVTAQDSQNYDVVARYIDHNLLESGWLIGEEALAKKAAMVSARIGEGRVVLFGFRPQHRDQTLGTFKLLFNSLVK